MPLAPELRSLLDACRDDYDEDSPRLVLADWLEENGDGRVAPPARAGVAGPVPLPLAGKGLAALAQSAHLETFGHGILGTAPSLRRLVHFDTKEEPF